MLDHGDNYTEYAVGPASRTPPAKRLASAVLARYIRDVIGNDEWDSKRQCFVRHTNDDGEALRDFNGDQTILERVAYQADYDPAYVRDTIHRLLRDGVSDRDVSKAASH